MDVATNERDALAKKAETVRAHIKEAEEMFSSLQSDYRSRVLSSFSPIGRFLIL
jgi:hypothetical protein